MASVRLVLHVEGRQDTVLWPDPGDLPAGVFYWEIDKPDGTGTLRQRLASSFDELMQALQRLNV